MVRVMHLHLPITTTQTTPTLSTLPVTDNNSTHNDDLNTMPIVFHIEMDEVLGRTSTLHNFGITKNRYDRLAFMENNGTIFVSPMKLTSPMKICHSLHVKTLRLKRFKSTSRSLLRMRRDKLKYASHS